MSETGTRRVSFTERKEGREDVHVESRVSVTVGESEFNERVNSVSRKCDDHDVEERLTETLR